MANEELILRIRADLRDVQSKLGRLERDGTDTSNKIGSAFERAGRRISNAFRAIRGPALAIGALGTGLAVLAQRSLAAAESIQDLADRANVSAEFLQELRFATNQSGASARDFDDAISRLNRRFGLFVQNLRTGEGEAGPAAAAFRALGLETRIASGELQNSEQVFEAAVDALQNVESQARRSAIASQLFGEDSGPRLVGLINRGTDGIRDMASEARALGIIMSDDLVRRGGEASDQLEILGTVIQARVTAAVVENAAEIDNMAKAFTEALPGIIQIVETLANAFIGVQDAIQGVAESFLGLSGGVGRGGSRSIDATEALANELRARAEEGERITPQFIQEIAQRSGFNRQAAESFASNLPENAFAGRNFGPDLTGGAVRRLTDDYVDLFIRSLEVQLESERRRASESVQASEAATAAPLLGSAGGGGGGGLGAAGGAVGGAFSPTPRVNPAIEMRAEAEAIREALLVGAAEWAGELARALEDENKRIADTFGRGAADGVISALDGNLDQFLARMFRQAAFNGLSEAFSSLAGSLQGGSRGGFFGAALRFGAGLFGPGKATGGTARGLTLVGEQGPELVNLGGMANVMTANMTRMALAGGRAAAPSAPGSQVVNLSTTVIDQSRGVDVSVRQISERDIQIMIDERAPRAVAGQFENQNSPVARSMRSNFQITPRRGNV